MEPDNYQAQSDFRTLMDAHKIKADKKRHGAAMAHAKTQLASMQAVTAGVQEKTETKAQEKGETPAQKRAEKKAGLD